MSAGLVCRKRSWDQDPEAAVTATHFKRNRTGSSPPPPAAAPSPNLKDLGWAGRIVGGLTGVSSIEEAVAVTSSALAEFEAGVEARVAAQATQVLEKERMDMAAEKSRYQEEAAKVLEEAAKMKERVDGLVSDNSVLKKGVVILNEKVQKQDGEIYTLRAHLNQALQGTSVFEPHRHVF